ncbi:MAG: C25 family cysteine peptidase [Brevefilum sp.]
MKRELRNMLMVIIVLALLGSGIHPAVSADAVLTDEVNLLSSNSSGVEFEVSVPWQTLQLEVMEVDGASYTYLDLPGWANTSQEGAPALPFVSQSLGAPFGAELSIEVIPGRAHAIPLNAPVFPTPSPTRQVDYLDPSWADPEIVYVIEPDPEIYIGSGAYPGALAEITADGQLRQQRLVGVGVYPVQYDPVANVLIVYESLQIKITFQGQPDATRDFARLESETYETFFKSNLINYEDARAWRDASQPDASLRNQRDTTRALPWQPPDPGWRIAIREEGLYRLTYATLIDAGLPLETIDPRTIKIFSLGEEIAIRVMGEDDGVFDQDDVIIFYGQGIDSKYTADNIYWLTYGEGPGNRMGLRNGALLEVPDPVPSYYMSDLYLEENHDYRSTLTGEDDLERFYWVSLYAYKNPISWSHDFSIRGPFDGSGTLQIALFGSLRIPEINPDHHAIVSVNDVEVADVYWDGFSWAGSAGFVEADIPAGVLIPGTNTITVALPNDTGAGLDLVLVDWVSFKFSNAFPTSAEDNQLAFSYGEEGAWTFQVTGFDTDEVVAYDVSDPLNMVEIDPDSLLVEDMGSDYMLSFRDEISTSKDYVAAAVSAIPLLPISAIESDTPSTLWSPDNRADYILISPRAFWDQAEALAMYRAGQGLVTILVDIQDVYDEFGFGIVDAGAIYDFLAFAYENWSPPAPTYVLLFGDGHYDPKNYFGNSPPSFIPPFLSVADPWNGETAADERYVSFLGPETMSQMMLGRLPVNTVAEANAVLQKIFAYEVFPVEGDWSKTVLTVAGAADSAGDFAKYANNLVRDSLPNPYQAEHVHFMVTHTDPNQARAALQSGINAGKLIVNFIGHGFTEGWSAQKNPAHTFIRSSDVAQLTNQDKYPIFLAMTCSEGSFMTPGKDAFGETIVRAENKGAIASWSPTGLGVSSGHDYMNSGFFDSVFKNGAYRLGEAVIGGLSRLYSTWSNLYLLDTYILLGDPALVINHAPVAVDDFYYTGEDMPINVAVEEGVLVNDFGFAPGNPLSASLAGDVEHGQLVFNSDGSFSYVPDQDWYGEDSFTYHAYDGEEFVGTAKVTITVYPINDPPVAYPQTIETPMNTPVEIFLTGSDVEGDTLKYKITRYPVHGQLTPNMPPESEPGEWHDLETGLIYQPDQGYHGSDSFIYIVNDGKANSEPATISINIWKENEEIYLYLPLILN